VTVPARSAASNPAVSVHWNTKPRSEASWRNSLWTMARSASTDTGGGKMLHTIGLMSGTSLDGVDAAWLETDGERIGRFGPTLTLPYDDRLRADLRRLLDHAPTLDRDDRRLKTAVARLTEYHVRAVTALGQPADLIGFHGQTILHQPEQQRTW